MRQSSGYSASLSVVRLALAIVAIPVLTHTLGLSLYGLWSVTLSFLSLTVLMQLGMGPAVTFHIAQAATDESSARRILVTSFVLFGGLGLLAGCALSLGSGHIARLAFRQADMAQEAENVLPILGLAALPQFLRNWVMAAEAGLQRFDLQAWADGIGTICLYCGLVILGALGSGVVGLAAWWAFSSFGTLIGHWYLWRTRGAFSVPLKSGWDATHARRLLHFGLLQWPSQLGGNLFGHVDRLLVNMILGTSAAGLYSAATSVAVRINELSAAPLQVIGPAIAAAKSPDRRAGLYQDAQALNALLAYTLASLVILGAQPLASVVVPTQAQTMTTVVRILGLCYGVYSMNAVGFFAAQGLGRPSVNSRWVMAAGIVFLLVLVPLSHTFGLRGAAWANLAYALTLGINLEITKKLNVPKRTSLLATAIMPVSLGGCFVISSLVLPATDSPLVQLVVATTAFFTAGYWIFIRFIRAAMKPIRLSPVSS